MKFFARPRKCNFHWLHLNVDRRITLWKRALFDAEIPDNTLDDEDVKDDTDPLVRLKKANSSLEKTRLFLSVNSGRCPKTFKTLFIFKTRIDTVKLSSMWQKKITDITFTVNKARLFSYNIQTYYVYRPFTLSFRYILPPSRIHWLIIVQRVKI